jgi:predicted site-specific integrase-resolvase
MRGPSTMPAPRGMNVISAARYMGVSAGTFRKLVKLGVVPAPMNIPEVNRNIYDREAIDKAMTALAQQRTTGAER